MTRKAPILVVIGSRPTETTDCLPIPATAAIYNAPRPLYGSLTWTDRSPAFRSMGRFFAALDFEAGDDFDRDCARDYAVENARLDARELRFVSEDEAFETGVVVTRERYAGTPVAQKLEGMIADPHYRQSFVHNGLEALAAEQKNLEASP
jgi:hypothetical protein